MPLRNKAKYQILLTLTLLSTYKLNILIYNTKVYVVDHLLPFLGHLWNHVESIPFIFENKLIRWRCVHKIKTILVVSCFLSKFQIKQVDNYVFVKLKGVMTCPVRCYNQPRCWDRL